jgi:hypothetical protein
VPGYLGKGSTADYRRPETQCSRDGGRAEPGGAEARVCAKGERLEQCYCTGRGGNRRMGLEQESAESAANGSTAPPAKASGEANAPLLRSPACGQGTQVPRILVPGRSGRLWPGEGYALLLGARFRRVLKF